jgi:hypothetical protein
VEDLSKLLMEVRESVDWKAAERAIVPKRSEGYGSLAAGAPLASLFFFPPPFKNLEFLKDPGSGRFTIFSFFDFPPKFGRGGGD